MSTNVGVIVLGGLAVAVVGGIVWSVLDDDRDDIILGPGKQGQTSGNKDPSPAELAAKLTCARALDFVPDAGLVDSIEQILSSSGGNAAALDAFAISLEAAAGSSGRSLTERAALLRLAQCVREKKAGVALGDVAKMNAAPASSSPSMDLGAQMNRQDLPRRR